MLKLIYRHITRIHFKTHSLAILCLMCRNTTHNWKKEFIITLEWRVIFSRVCFLVLYHRNSHWRMPLVAVLLNLSNSLITLQRKHFQARVRIYKNWFYFQRPNVIIYSYFYLFLKPQFPSRQLSDSNGHMHTSECSHAEWLHHQTTLKKRHVQSMWEGRGSDTSRLTRHMSLTIIRSHILQH